MTNRSSRKKIWCIGDTVSLPVVLVAVTLLFASTARARKYLPKIKLKSDGYYWTRFVYINDLANLAHHRVPGTATGLREPIIDTRYLTHHVRWEPRVTFGHWARLYSRLDALRDVVWGDNDGQSTAPLLDSTPSQTNFLGKDVPSIQLTNIYLDLDLKVGKIKLGRMPVHWGMGLLYNSGGNLLRHRAGVDDDFGDNYFPSIFDRIMLSTDVLKLVERLWGTTKKKSNHRLIAAYTYDRIVEEPHSGHSPMDYGRVAGEQGFLSRQQNNIEQHSAVLYYRWDKFADGIPFINKFGTTRLIAGLYGAYRRQRAIQGVIRLWDPAQSAVAPIDCSTNRTLPQCGTRSDLYILDPYIAIKLGRLLSLKSEGYVISGNTDPSAVPLGDKVNRVRVYGWALRATSKIIRWLHIRMETGQASGDRTHNDSRYEQRALHADHNVGLILYEEFLKQRSAAAPLTYGSQPPAGGPRTWSTAGGSSHGGVINSYYFMPTVVAHFVDFISLRLGLLNAWSHKQDGVLFPRGRGRHIGTELDIGLDVRWGKGDDTLRHLLLRLEGGYLFFGSQVSADYDSYGVFSIQARLAFVL
jgi:hypothetical protein